MSDFKELNYEHVEKNNEILEKLNKIKINDDEFVSIPKVVFSAAEITDQLKNDIKSNSVSTISPKEFLLNSNSSHHWGGAIFRGLFNNFVFTGHFYRCNFNGINLSGSLFTEASFHECLLDSIDFSGCSINEKTVTFSDCSFVKSKNMFYIDKGIKYVAEKNIKDASGLSYDFKQRFNIGVDETFRQKKFNSFKLALERYFQNKNKFYKNYNYIRNMGVKNKKGISNAIADFERLKKNMIDTFKELEDTDKVYFQNIPKTEKDKLSKEFEDLINSIDGMLKDYVFVPDTDEYYKYVPEDTSYWGKIAGYFLELDKL